MSIFEDLLSKSSVLDTASLHKYDKFKELVIKNEVNIRYVVQSRVMSENGQVSAENAIKMSIGGD